MSFIFAACFFSPSSLFLLLIVLLLSLWQCCRTIRLSVLLTFIVCVNCLFPFRDTLLALDFFVLLCFCCCFCFHYGHYIELLVSVFFATLVFVVSLLVFCYSSPLAFLPPHALIAHRPCAGNIKRICILVYYVSANRADFALSA